MMDHLISEPIPKRVGGSSFSFLHDQINAPEVLQAFHIHQTIVLSSVHYMR